MSVRLRNGKPNCEPSLMELSMELEFREAMLADAQIRHLQGVVNRSSEILELPPNDSQ